MNNDLISRSALKETLHNEIGEHALSIAIDRVIDNAPTVKFERPKGEWINTQPLDYIGECSECCYISNKYYKFCPNCGADMRG